MKDINKIIFVTPFEYPTKMAHGIHGLSMAKAFSEYLGYENFLFFISDVRDQSILAGINYAKYAGNFGHIIKKLHLRRFFIPFFLFMFILINKKWRDKRVAIFVNDPVLMVPISVVKKFFDIKLICESHGFFSKSVSKTMSNNADRIIFVTKALKQEYVNKFPQIEKKSFSIPNAVNIPLFQKEKRDIKVLREEVNFPQDKIIIGYVGRFLPLGYDKGISLMIDSLKELQSNFACAFIGGSEDEIKNYSEYAKSINVLDRCIFVKHVSQEKIPAFMKSCDILAYVPAEKNDFFYKETSPMKLFEYMAAERPIMVSDTPAIREILDDESAYILNNPEVKSFIETVDIILKNKEISDKKVYNASKKVEKNSWFNRVRTIIQ